MLGSVRGVVSNDHSYRDKANPRVPTLFRARKLVVWTYSSC